ncbi:MAG TPA: DNA repair protein RecO [Gemmatimonadaceae bacterium]|nr:DNA repair protein RecO [Gemmatimonadaceae bacterium]
MPLLVSDAIVLHAFDYLESSRIFRLATREAGVRSALARGARRSQKRFGSALDLFAQGSAQLSVQPGRDLDTLTGFDVTESWPALSQDLGRFAGASTIAELVLHFASTNADPGLYDAVSAGLQAIARAEPDHAAAATLAAAWRVISALGFTPSLDECAECHSPVPGGVPAAFHLSAGGVLCLRCERQTPGGRRLPPEARAALHAWIAGRDAPTPDANAIRAHQRLLREFLSHHMVDGAPLRAFAAWEAGSWGATGVSVTGDAP